MSNARPGPPGGLGSTDFTVKQVLKADSPSRRDQKRIAIDKYVPADSKSPPAYLVFCDDKDGRLDAYRGTPVESASLIEYLRGALAIDPNSVGPLLAFASRFLDSPHPEVATEAYLEFARAGDADVLAAARGLTPARLRRLVDDPATPAERLSLFVYLLGACGDRTDVARISRWLAEPGERFRAARAGLLAAWATLDPAGGWKEILRRAGDSNLPFPERNSALAAVRFLRNAQPAANKSEVETTLRALLPQADIADLVVEDLRRWRVWDLAADVIAAYDLKSHGTPLTRRAILRYALECPTEAAKHFTRRERAVRPELVADVEECLQFERGPSKP